MIYHFSATLLKKKFIAENTVELTFSVTHPDFSFKAGQYVSIEIPALADMEIPDRRHDFSIASAPSVGEAKTKEISIAFRVSQSMFKTALLALPLGGVINIDGPKGVFCLPETTETPLIFVAGGIGITPLLSMIRYATNTASSQQIILLYCNTSKETTAYSKELTQLKQQNPHFSFNKSLGVPDEKLFAPYAQQIPDALWYVVGAPGMVEKVQQILRELHIEDTHVYIEEFSGYRSR